MNQDNRNFFWIICIVTVIGAIYWSVISVLQQPRPLFIAFLAINIVSLVVNIVCWFIDSKKTNTKNWFCIKFWVISQKAGHPFRVFRFLFLRRRKISPQKPLIFQDFFSILFSHSHEKKILNTYGIWTPKSTK